MPIFAASSAPTPGQRPLWLMLLTLLSGFALSQAFRTVTSTLAGGLQADFGLSTADLGAAAHGHCAGQVWPAPHHRVRATAGHCRGNAVGLRTQLRVVDGGAAVHRHRLLARVFGLHAVCGAPLCARALCLLLGPVPGRWRAGADVHRHALGLVGAWLG